MKDQLIFSLSGGSLLGDWYVTAFALGTYVCFSVSSATSFQIRFAGLFFTMSGSVSSCQYCSIMGLNVT